MNKSILDLDATTLAVKIRAGEITSTEATETYIAHLEAINPVLNVLVEDRFALAREEAKACDERIAKGEAVSGRLFGVPVSVKECMDLAGMKTTGGLPHRRDHVVTADADVVARMRAEGAIVLGKTNTPALCFYQETVNKLYGRTNNPWDVTRTAGGSSGGEGALIAAGGAALGIGSDIGGSVRFPAHFNGVIGFKSGNGQVSLQGQFPAIEEPLQQRMFGLGAMAKSVEDAELLHEIVALEAPTRQDLSRFSIILPPKHPKFPLGEATGNLLEQVEAFLRERFPIRHDNPPQYEKMAEIWQLAMSIDGAANVAEVAFGGRSQGPVGALMREVLTGKTDSQAHLSWALIGARMFKPSAQKVAAMRAQMQELDTACDAYLDQAILILPTYHVPAPKHGDLYREIFSIQKTYTRYMPYIAVANTLGLPTLTLPVGEADGLPIGLQLIARVGQEQALFELGRLLEQQFRGYVRCTLHDHS
ncbi:MAG TPA: amidase [Bacilli bacterium]|nr:amidase [Bacilli bacterium]